MVFDVKSYLSHIDHLRCLLSKVLNKTYYSLPPLFFQIKYFARFAVDFQMYLQPAAKTTYEFGTQKLLKNC